MASIRRVALAAWLLLLVCATSAVINFGPQYKATEGAVWPKPQEQVYYDGYMIVRPSTFTFKIIGKTCTLLQEAVERYRKVISAHVSSYSSTFQGAAWKAWKSDPLYVGYLDAVSINLIASCEDEPYADMDEHYELRINSPDLASLALLTSQSIWGILRGLETFSQLLYLDATGKALRVNSTAVMDFPRFTHRGLMLDTSRHYLSTATIKTMIDGMEMNKMNVFHWHIVDDQSFPYQSVVFPSLSEKGAYHPTKFIYTQSDVKNIIEYARLRGIRVIPEFDSPGHTLSWGQGQPDLLTPCYEGEKPDGTYGPINPTLKSTYTFVQTLFKEVVGLFPDKYMHLGGDEVSYSCWKSNPNITAFMTANNISSYETLEQYYMERVVNITSNLGADLIVWQEVFDNGITIPGKTVVHIWTGNQTYELSKVTAAGHPALLSGCWYLDHLEFFGGDWRKYYECEPTDFNGTSADKRLVIGGEACMWGESVDDSNVVPRVWPRASAAAEKLWSPADADTEEGAARRLEEHYCRMRRRGVGAQPPNGPGYCLL